jgi:hypothetical protein
MIARSFVWAGGFSGDGQPRSEPMQRFVII